MPFGISPAPEIFQKCLEEKLQGLEGVSNIHDDILVYGEGETSIEATKNHDERMEALLRWCVYKNIVLND